MAFSAKFPLATTTCRRLTNSIMPLRVFLVTSTCNGSAADAELTWLTRRVSLARDIEKQAATVSDDQTHSASLVILWSVLDSLVTSPSMSKLSRIAHIGIGHRSRFWKILDIDRRPCVSWSVPSRWGLININSLCSEVYFWIAIVHYNEKRVLEALDAAEEAWRLSEEPHNNLVDQARMSLLLGVILFSANRDTEAWKWKYL